MKKNLVLTGMMGVGKSTIGKLLSKNLKMQFIDIDSEIEKNELMPIKNVFKKKGEKYFREIEKKITLKKIKEKNSIIALGGGSFEDLEVREEILENCISFWLDLNLKETALRLKNSKKRPLLTNTDALEKDISEIYNKRKSTYNQAHFKIKCNNLNKDIIVKNITEIFYEI